MTLESSFPYVSLAAALWAGALAGGASPAAERALKASALGVLALYAYFREIAPAEVPAALMLGAWAEAFSRPPPGRWRGAGALLRAAGRLTFGYLFLRIGEGRSAFLSDAAKAALLVAVLFGAGFGLARLWPATKGVRWGLAAEAAALTFVSGAVLTLNWSFWPSMAGAAAVAAADALLCASAFLGRPAPGAALARWAWGLNYFGQAAMAFAFLR